MSFNVCKFGGTSMADGECFKNVAEIILASPKRRFIVVSAPGKRFEQDRKVTDLLISVSKGNKECYEELKKRFSEIMNELKIKDATKDIVNNALDELWKNGNNLTEDYITSRGEFLNAIILQAYMVELGVECQFVDSKDLIEINEDKTVNEEATLDKIRSRLSEDSPLTIIPGFYGADKIGSIKTLPRGGSDTTASYLAVSLFADECEFWKDEDGILSANPNIKELKKTVEVSRLVSFNELQELTSHGMPSLHPDSVFPLSKANIPIHFYNTKSPTDIGTFVSNSFNPLQRMQRRSAIFVSISSQSGIRQIIIQNDSIHSDKNFLPTIWCELNGINIGVIPSSIKRDKYNSCCSLLAFGENLSLENLEKLNLGTITLSPTRYGRISIVGENLQNRLGMLADCASALKFAGINVCFVSQDISEHRISLGVEEADITPAIIALHNLKKLEIRKGYRNRRSIKKYHLRGKL